LSARRLAFAQLLEHDFVGLESDTVISQLLLAQARRADKPLRLRVQVKSFDVLAKLVQAGLGIGVLPEAAARAFAGPLGLRLVSLSDAWATRRMFVAVRPNEVPPAPARLLVEHLAGAVTA
jgi:DNA-binding transcriptional LysR family regulator